MNSILNGEWELKGGLTPFRITLIYALVGATWILFSDQLLGMFVSEPGTIIWLQTLKGWLFIIVTAGMLYGLMHRNIAVIRRSNKALRESEERYRTLTDDVLESSSVGIFILDPDFRVVWINNSLERYFGLQKDSVIGKDKRELIRKRIMWIFAEPDVFAEKVLATYNDNTYIENFECHVLPDGEREERWLEHWSQPIRSGLYAGGRIEHYYDITGRKRAEEHILHLQNVLKAIRNINQLLVYEKDRNRLLQRACEILNQTQNYRLVWIGMVTDGTKEVFPVAQAGFENGYLKSVRITWDDSESGRGPTGTSIRTGRPFVMRDIAGDPRYSPWREEALKRGYASSAAVPMVYEERVFGALNVYSTTPDAFDDKEIELLSEVGRDIAFALYNIELEERHRQAEKELQERRDARTRLAVITKERSELQRWINTFDTFVGKFDLEGKIIFCNDAPIKAAGLTREDVFGRYFPDTPWWSHSRTERAKIVECFERAKKGLSSRIETNFRDAEGRPVPIIFNCQPVLDENGKVEYITAEGKVITEEVKLRKALQEEKEHLEKRVAERAAELIDANRKLEEEIAERRRTEKTLRESEEKFRHLSEEISDGISITVDGKNYWVNKAFSDIFGYTREELIGKGVDFLVVPEEVPGLVKRMKDRLAGKDVPAYYETIARRKDGRRINIEVSAKVITFDGRQAIQVVVHDITERKQVEEALRRAHYELEAKVAERTRELARANAKLKEIDRIKSEFLATMSHELRTPLNSIIGFIGIILKGFTGEINEEQKKQLSMAYTSAEHLSGLINDILDLSRIESGKMELFIEEFRIEDVVTETTRTLSGMISQKGLKLVTEIQDGMPEIRSDRKKVLQILLNLLNNAVKFTDKGEIRIKCSMVDNNNLVISVSDTGIGIRDEDMDHLFEAFRQIDGTARRRYQGAGLGLYLCKKLATLLRGRILAESEYGMGSKFTLEIPVRLEYGRENEEDTGGGRQ
jgi:PAS domain S-box-containing protein